MHHSFSQLAAILLLALFPCVAIAEEITPVLYTNRSDLLVYRDPQGMLQPVKTAEDWQHRVNHIRTSMEAVMGRLPVDSPLPLDIQYGETTPMKHYSRRHVAFTVEQGDRLTGWLLIPHVANDRMPQAAMICLPGSSKEGKDNPVGLGNRAEMAYAHELACRGYVCLSLDYPILHAKEYHCDPYQLGYQSATMKGIVNHRRGIDLLQSLPFVDREKVGVIGHSLGGHNALFLAVFDDRIKAIVSSCGFNVFAKHNGGDIRAWSSRYYMPLIKTRYGDDPKKLPFDFTEVLAALAPRPVFANAPLHDQPDFEVSGVRDCFDAAMPVYTQIFNAQDQLQARYPDTGHRFPPAERQAAYAFLDKHLRRQQSGADLNNGLAAHWPLQGDFQDKVNPSRIPVRVGQVDLNSHKTSAAFFGAEAFIAIGANDAPRISKQDFSLAMWLRCDEPSDSLPGDLISQYDVSKKRGFHLTLKSAPGSTTNQANWRNLQFGIDDDHSSRWRDCGRPGNATLAFALAVHNGNLYAGTCEPGIEQSGRVYRYAGNSQWIDCGAPDRSNSVTSLAVYRGELYAGTGKYRLAGSSLAESGNPNLGGRIYRYDDANRWVDCGQLPNTEAVGGMVVFQDRLYASSLYRPAGFFRYQPKSTDSQSDRWTSLPVPTGLDLASDMRVEKRVEALTVFEKYLYASSYDGGHVYRFDGTQWTDCGLLGDNTQTYSFAQYQGKLHVGTWPSGKVFRFENVNRWTDVGRLGEELEVMGMSVHNGRLIAGTLPLAEVYAYDGAQSWQRLTQLDSTPDVKYRRAWTMAEHDGEVYCSTLPSGKVFAYSQGHQAAWGHPLPNHWCHVTAIKSGQQLRIYLDGELVAMSHLDEQANFDLNCESEMRIGSGTNGPLNGRLSDVRIYTRALNDVEAEALAKQSKPN
jgi:pimeloyl-ACP methyl ester carboxylesterase